MRPAAVLCGGHLLPRACSRWPAWTSSHYISLAGSILKILPRSPCSIHRGSWPQPRGLQRVFRGLLAEGFPSGGQAI